MVRSIKQYRIHKRCHRASKAESKEGQLVLFCYFWNKMPIKRASVAMTDPDIQQYGRKKNIRHQKDASAIHICNKTLFKANTLSLILIFYSKNKLLKCYL